VSTPGGIGHFVPWDGGCVFIGRNVGVVPEHAHYAIQIAFGAEPGLRFRTAASEPWISYGGAIIPTRQPHSMDATAVSANAVLFVEPETREGRALTELYLRNGIAAMPDDVLAERRPPLFAAWRAQRSARAVAEAGRDLVQALTGGLEPAVVSDERILRAIAFIKSHIDEPLTLDAVAEQAYLSPSRFRHLFVEQTGMAMRPYILWRRFLRVWELLSAGETLSSAAHRSGFADAAHLTRTARRMFGFPPSAMRIGGALPADDPALRSSAPGA
jgi:AraC-like DNA-binding protein